MSVLAYEILQWLDKLHRGEEHGAEVVTVGTLTEAYILSARTACDAVAFLLGNVVPLKKGQAPNDSLRGLVDWAKKNPTRIHALHFRCSYPTTLVGSTALERYAIELFTTAATATFTRTDGSSTYGYMRTLAAG